MFNNIFGKKPTVKEQQRENDRSLRKATRDIERERRKLEEEEKKLMTEIKRNAAAGNNDACKILAKQLIEIRKQKSRSYAAAGKITSIGYQNKNMGANIALGEAMGSTAKAMASMNKVMRPEAIAGTVRDFQQANMRMEMTDEMINDTLDDMLDESGDEEESNGVINKVLDEIGIEISGKMANIPATGSSEFESSGKRTEKDIADQLAKLRSS
ncbi:CHMP2B [Drosophila busckii]|uniref:CHMP2B n=1 Tax=Drosophila busckii TaxID=30019 RepID=A0A0M4E8A2_DROBS|nr:charged multivesicular body protein 2b [Drosophila busckii]ALC43078.1 CHMP2B [Drosophila busckii]